MLLSTIVAVATGLVPVNPDGNVTGNYDYVVGRYIQSVDRRGTTHVRGFTRQTGAPYDLEVSKDGNVEGTVGAWTVSFRAREID